ncbi:MAG: 5-formyltetrahydrofolate cyclo-ligase [Thermoplasmatales archaeon]|nr:MAG: 5-formyltetrahydrofolate cyclo-ligase [Thermoplasmatales archaeon]
MKSKKEIRQLIWDLLEEKNVVTFPRPVRGRIPNFVGANVAAEKLDELALWRKARMVKSNPDAPQRRVRENALRHGKTVYMAVPRLREEKCFLKIDPKKIPNVNQASSIKGAFRFGENVFPDEMEKVDVIIVGSVAVNKQGAKVGKGGGFSDLEYVIAREFGIVDENTPTLTTVHPLQFVDYEIPMDEHDVPIGYVVTPRGVIKTDNSYIKPKEIDWSIIGDKIKEIPVLQKLKNRE